MVALLPKMRYIVRRRTIGVNRLTGDELKAELERMVQLEIREAKASAERAEILRSIRKAGAGQAPASGKPHGEGNAGLPHLANHPARAIIVRMLTIMCAIRDLP